MTICKRTFALLMTMIMLVSFIPAAAMAATDGWVKEGGSWYYYEKGKAVTGWKKIGKNWYYFQPDKGRMVDVPSQLIGDKWYAFQSTGENCTRQGWNKVVWSGSEYWFYIKKDGSCYTGWVKDSSGFYFLSNAPRYMEKNTTVSYLGVTYKLDKDGHPDKTPPKSGWKYYSNAWFYLKNYEMLTGWQTIDGKKYYFALWGNMVQGVPFKVNGKPMLFKDSGELYSKTGWIKLHNIWYYLKKGGYCTVGWKQLGGKWYCFDEHGRMYLDMQTIDGKNYYFYSDGSMAVSTTIKWEGHTYKVDANGVCTMKK